MTFEEFEARVAKQKEITHCWNDNWPHWKELYEAEEYIAGYVYKWSRCRLQSKEKWGQLRYEHIWPPSSRLNGPIVQLPFPLFAKTIEGEKFPRYLIYWTSSWLYYKWMRLGEIVLRRGVKKACKKFPNVVKEITADLNWR